MNLLELEPSTWYYLFTLDSFENRVLWGFDPVAGADGV